MKWRVAIVVAHPDDEVIYFGGLIRRLANAGAAVDVVCTTSTFHPERMTPIRRAEFTRSCWLLGARARLLGLDDTPGLLDEARLDRELAHRVRWPDYRSVYTHGVHGEYGHRHHVQVCRATHRYAGDILSLSGLLRPVISHLLTDEEYAVKREVARTAYHSQPFATDWCTREERFTRLTVDEADRLASIALRHSYPQNGPGAPLTDFSK